MFYKAISRTALEPAPRIRLLKIVICVALICGFLLSWRLWVSSRLFPSCPLFLGLPRIPFPLDYIWLIALIGLLVSIAIRTNASALILTFLILSALLAVFDQMRWQPWFYQYFVMLAVLGIYTWKKSETKITRAAINTCALIVVCAYFWSGVEKPNAAFIKESWPDFSRPLFQLLLGPRNIPPIFGFSIPVFEILIAIGLLTRRFRKVSVILAIASHALILVFLVASGENTVVWPWNIAMSLFVAILFWQHEEISFRKVFTPKYPFHAVIFILFAILPAFSLIGLWDSYLSFALYSGNDYQAIIYVTQTVRNQLPAAITPYIWQQTEPAFLDLNRWAYGELNVPIYPEPRVFRRIAQRICEYASNNADIKLAIKDQPDLLTGHRDTQYYDCDHLP